MGLIVNSPDSLSRPIFWRMTTLWDWNDLARELEHKPRGSRRRLALALEMDTSDLARRLLRGGELTVRQMTIAKDFLEGSDPSGSAASKRPKDEVPFYGYAAGGGEELIAFTPGQFEDAIKLPRGLTLSDEYFAVQAIGSSMEPRIFAGERRLARLNTPPSRDTDVVVEFHDGTALLKTYKSQRDGLIYCHQWNPDKEVRIEATKVKALHSLLRV